MRIILKPASGGRIEVWRGHVHVATIYPSPGGITMHTDAEIDPTDIDLDPAGRAVHVELKQP
jgi:hypothetical protein